MLIYNIIISSNNWLILGQSLDEQQSVQILQSYLQEDYRGTKDSIKVWLFWRGHSSGLIIDIELGKYNFMRRYIVAHLALSRFSSIIN